MIWLIATGDIQLGSAEAGSPARGVLLWLRTAADHWRHYCTEVRWKTVNLAWPGFDVSFDAANTAHHNYRRLRSFVCHTFTRRSGSGIFLIAITEHRHCIL